MNKRARLLRVVARLERLAGPTLKTAFGAKEFQAAMAIAAEVLPRWGDYEEKDLQAFPVYILNNLQDLWAEYKNPNRKRMAEAVDVVRVLEKLAREMGQPRIPPAQVASLIEKRLAPKHGQLVNQLDQAFSQYVSLLNAVSTLGQRSNDAKMAELGKNRAGRAQALQQKIKDIFGGDLSGMGGA